MGFALDPLSLKHMWGVHPDLIAVVKECADKGVMPFTFGVSEGLRTMANQKIAVASGKSQTLNSRHLDGHAVDLVVLIHGKVTWDWPPYHTLAHQMKAAAARCNIPITWGGDWTTLKDGPHYELPRDKYPSGDFTPPSA